MTASVTARRLEAVLFDLDGVLVDSEGAWDAARRAIVAEAGGRWRASATRAMMGMSAAEWSQYLHDELGVPLDASEINERVVARLLAAYRQRLPLLPGAVEAVKRLAARWPLGLASSSNREVIDAVLAASGRADSFAATVSGDEVARGKPAPDVYLAAANKLGAAPARAAAVEDSSNGLRAAPPAVVNLSKSLAQEFGPRGIRVNCVSPGQVSTDLWLGEHGVAQTIAQATGVDAATVRESATAGIATGRFTTPEEVATLVALLASNRTANVTGVNYVIDGGLIKTT
jgi:HAD superfamily hydrolase (TIGR01509 family)